MSEAHQSEAPSYALEMSAAETAKRDIGWPVFLLAFALICAVAWDLALLWLAVKLCLIVFF